jgi:hypothetical protein
MRLRDKAQTWGSELVMDGSGTADQVDRVAVSPGVSTAGATQTREVDPLTVTQRLQREGRWKDIEPERNEMMKLARKTMEKPQAQLWVYAELDRMYPPAGDPQNPPLAGDPASPSLPASTTKPANGGSDSEQIQGLGDLPAVWPELPANASLSAEIAWVQANRLRIVEERPGAATLVRLGRAMSPAPSWAALGWLETSIRSYAKYVDVAAKATSTEEGEAAVMKRERMAQAEVEALLAEMRVEARRRMAAAEEEHERSER